MAAREFKVKARLSGKDLIQITLMDDENLSDEKLENMLYNRIRNYVFFEEIPQSK